MTYRYVLSIQNDEQIKTSVHELVKALKADRTLDTEGVVLVCGEVEIVLGKYGTPIFEDKSLVDDVCLHMTPIIYELLGYLSPELRYTAVSSIPDGTTLCRIMHVQDQVRTPLYAVNMTPIKFDGYWRDIDRSLPSSLTPTFELMGIEAGQQISLNGKRADLDSIDLHTVHVCELSRIGSLLETVLGKSRIHTLPPEPLVDRFKAIVSQYQRHTSSFIQVMMLVRGALALAFWIYLMVNENDLIFGNLSPGSVDRFIESMGVTPDLRAVHLLKISRIYHESNAVQTFRPYFEHHRVIPFFIEWKKSVQDVILQKGCECLCATTPTL